MPNGVSCLYFAGKNLIYGKKEGNVFKDGIGAIQTVRGVDFLSKSTAGANSTANAVKCVKNPFLSKAANTLKKFLYPLIILSGVFNTIKSKDKVKTGVQQTGGIGLMYGLECLAEKGLNVLDKKIMSSPTTQTNKMAKIGWYIAKGAAFTIASITGYTLGSKGGEKLVDVLRNRKEKKAEKKAQKKAAKAEKKAAKEVKKLLKQEINNEVIQENTEEPKVNIFEEFESIF